MAEPDSATPDEIRQWVEEGDLHWLIECNPSVEDVQAVLDKYPDKVHEEDEVGELPLHGAAWFRASVEVINLLLEKNKSAVEKKDNYGRLPLHYAASVGAVKALLDAYPEGAKEKDENGDLPLHIALRRNKCEVVVVKALLDVYPEGAKEKNKYGELPLNIVLWQKGEVAVLNALLDVYPEGVKAVDNEGNLPLHIALLSKCEVDEVKAVLDVYPEGAKATNRKGNLPLHITVREKCGFEVVKAVLGAYREGVEMKDNEGDLPLHIALSNEYGLSVVKALLDAYPKGAETKNDSGRLPLHIGLEKKCDFDVVDALLDAYLEGVKATDNEGKLPLHIGLQHNVDSDIIYKVVNKYHEVLEVKDNDGNLPLHTAAQYYKTNINVIGKGKALPAHEIETNRDENSYGASFLHWYPEGIKTRNNEGKLPLQIAIEHEREADLVETLLKRYPEGVKSLGKVGKQTFSNAIEKGYPKKIVFALLLADMPLDKDGNFIDHTDSWNVCIASEEFDAVEAVRLVLSKHEGNFGRYIHTLMDVRDARGRQSLGLASERALSVINMYLLFCRRYKLSLSSPEHRTLTSLLLRALDLNDKTDYGKVFDKADTDNDGTLDREELKNIAISNGLNPDLFLKASGEGEGIKKDEFVSICKRQLGDGPREVVIKLMRSKEHYERECNARKKHNLSPKYVVSALPNIPPEEAFKEAVRERKGGLDIIAEKYLKDIEIGEYAIVMDAADRNLQQIFYQEQPKIDAVRDILRQVFEAVNHLHEKKLMHGDLKMPNIVRMRVDNRLLLIDFDASAEIVQPGEDGESFAGAKFSSAVLPPEMIAKLEPDQVDEFNAYWQDEKDEGLKGKIEPKIYSKRGIEIGQYVVKSFRTEGGVPVFEGLPYGLVNASENIDAWSLGVLAFTLLTGEPLISSNRDDDCASGTAMHLLHTWGERPEILTERFKNISDDAARDLIQQLLQREPEKRPKIAELLQGHAFFHPKNKAMECEMKKRLKSIDDSQRKQIEALKEQAKQMKKMAADITMIKNLSHESKFELARTRHILVNCMIEATTTDLPSGFIVFNDKLPEISDEAENKISNFVAEEDGSGVSVKTNNASLALSEEQVELKTNIASMTVTDDKAMFQLEGEFKEYQEQLENGIEWAKRIKEIASKIAGGDTEAAFEIIKNSIGDLIVGDKMYFYLIDNLTGKPARGKGWPIEITKPSDIVPKLLPVMVNTMRAMSILNGAAGLVKMCGFPAPNVPKAWSKGLKESVDLLKQDSSVAEFGVVNKEVKNGTEENKSLRGKAQREFEDFLRKHDPGLKEGKSGDFAGLQRIGDPEDGTVLWTKLTDQKDIEKALRERAKYREEEERRESELCLSQKREGNDTDNNKKSKEEQTSEGVSEAQHQPTEIPTVMSTTEVPFPDRNHVVLKNARNVFVTSAEVDAMIKAAATNDDGPPTSTVTNYNVNVCSNGCSIM